MKYAEQPSEYVVVGDNALANDYWNFRSKDDKQSSSEPVNSSNISREYDNIDMAYSIGMELLSKHLSVITLNENLQPPQTHKEYLSSSFRMNEKLLRMSLPYNPNLGVLTGKLSMNLFVLRAQSMRSFQEIGPTFSEKLMWVSRCENTYFAWFLCWDGIVTNSIDTYTVDVLGDKQIVVVPGSKLPDGSCAEWHIHEGTFPPIIYHSDFDQSPLNGIRIKHENASDTQDQIKKYVYAGSDRNGPTVIDKLILFAELHDFGKGIKGINKRLLFRALIQRAKHDTHSDFRATPRELEQMTTISRKSIVKYLREFQRDGLLTKIRNTDLGNRYSFELAGQILPKVSMNNHDVTSIEISNHECWSSRGLGSSGKTIIELLLKATDDQHLDILTISRLTGVNRITVSKKLKLMSQFKLVKKLDGSWVVDKTQLTVENMNFIARELGVNGFFRKRKERSDNERREYLIGKAICRNSRTFFVNNHPSP